MSMKDLRYRLEDLRDWFKDLDIREKLNENPIVMVAGVGVVLLLCLSVIFCQLVDTGSSSVKVKYVYFDDASKSIRVVEFKLPEELPTSPLEGTDNVYMATVFSCEDCPKGSVKDGMTLAELEAAGMYIGWLSRIDPGKESQGAMLGEDGYDYRRLDEEVWHKEFTPEVDKIRKEATSKCEKSMVCWP